MDDAQIERENLWCERASCREGEPYCSAELRKTRALEQYSSDTHMNGWEFAYLVCAGAGRGLRDVAHWMFATPAHTKAMAVMVFVLLWLAFTIVLYQLTPR